MPTKVKPIEIEWKCDFCSRRFKTERGAKACENRHEDVALLPNTIYYIQTNKSTDEKIFHISEIRYKKKDYVIHSFSTHGRARFDILKFVNVKKVRLANLEDIRRIFHNHVEWEENRFMESLSKKVEP